MINVDKGLPLGLVGVSALGLCCAGGPRGIRRTGNWGRFVSASRRTLIGRRVTRCVAAAGLLVFTLGVAHAAPAADAKKKPAPAVGAAAPGLALENAVPVTIPKPARIATRSTPAAIPSLSSFKPMDIPIVEAPVAKPTPAPLTIAKPPVSPKFDATPQSVASTLPPREPTPPPRVEVAAVPSADAPTPAPTAVPAPRAVVPGAAATAAPKIEIPPLPDGPLTLRFADDAGALEREGDALIATLAIKMGNEPTMRLSLRSYARATDDPREARKVSLRRVTAVRDKLISLGIRQTRVDLRALGAQPANDDKPADRIEIDILTN